MNKKEFIANLEYKELLETKVEEIFRIRQPLNQIKIFHTIVGLKFDNKEIDEILDKCKILRSLIIK